MAAQWPEVEELAQVLNLDNVTDWETTLDRVMAAAIAKVKSDARLWGADDEDTPSDSLAQAALRMAELISTRPDNPANEVDPTYLNLLTGGRRGWGIS
jgi:hypothetical protein